MAKITKKKAPAVSLDLSAIATLLKLDEAASREQPPAYPVTAILFDADRAFTEYQRSKADFANLPTFNASLFVHATELRDALANAEKKWRLTRVAKSALDRTGMRKDAEFVRGELMAAARFVCRNDDASKLELDRIDEGDGLDDLVLDLDDLVTFANGHAALLVEGQTLPKGILARATELARALRSASEPPEAAEQRGERNLLAAIVVALLKELRAVATFRYRSEPKRAAAFASGYAPKKRAPRKPAAQT